MSKEEIKDLTKFLQPFSKEIQELAMWLREFIWDLYPNTNELIYDNYNAVAVGWSPTDRVGTRFAPLLSAAINTFTLVFIGAQK